jgi:hypothetical protein
MELFQDVRYLVVHPRVKTMIIWFLRTPYVVNHLMNKDAKMKHMVVVSIVIGQTVYVHQKLINYALQLLV